MLIGVKANDDPRNSIRFYINPALPSGMVYLEYKYDQISVSDRIEELLIAQNGVLLKTPYAYTVSVLKYEDGRNDVYSVIANTEEAALWMQTSATDEREAMFRLGRTKIYIDKRLKKITIVAPVGYDVAIDPDQYGRC